MDSADMVQRGNRQFTQELLHQRPDPDFEVELAGPVANHRECNREGSVDCSELDLDLFVIKTNSYASDVLLSRFPDRTPLSAVAPAYVASTGDRGWLGFRGLQCPKVRRQAPPSGL